MSTDATQRLPLDEGSLNACIREAAAKISKHAETIGLAGQQLQQVLQDVSGAASERELRAVTVTIRAITLQLALVTLDVSTAVGELETVASIKALVELNQ